MVLENIYDAITILCHKLSIESRITYKKNSAHIEFILNKNEN